MCSVVITAVIGVLLKRLANDKIHYSIVTIYASYFGLPLSLLISGLMIFTGLEKKDAVILADKEAVTAQIVYSILASVIGVLQQVFFNISLKHEEASKIAIIRSTDFFFTFLFQYLWLNIETNIYNGLGCVFIIAGAILILVYKILDKKYSQQIENNPFLRILFIKL